MVRLAYCQTGQRKILFKSANYYLAQDLLVENHRMKMKIDLSNVDKICILSSMLSQVNKSIGKHTGKKEIVDIYKSLLLV